MIIVFFNGTGPASMNLVALSKRNQLLLRPTLSVAHVDVVDLTLNVCRLWLEKT